MHQNIVRQSLFYNSSDTTDSAKLDQPNIHLMPFSLSLNTSITVIACPASSRSLWANSEKQKYSVFCCYFRELLNGLTVDKINWNVFKGMAKFIQSRNPQQCRSHHLKLIKEFDGIGKFLSRSVKRIRRVEEKMHQAERLLTEIQEEFQLYYEEFQEAAPKQIIFLTQSTLMKKAETDIQFSVALQKMDKEELKKTAASYEEDQNPVKDNNFFGSLSLSKSFTNLKTKANRSSLPSFENDEKFTKTNTNQNQLEEESLKRLIKDMMGFSSQNVEMMSDKINFDTFAVPDHIRTTSQMYKLWQNSSRGFGIKRKEGGPQLKGANCE